MAQSVWLFKGAPFDHGDSGLQGFINFSQFFYQFYMWGPTNYTGLITTTGSPLGFILSAVNALLLAIFGLAIGPEILYGLLIAAGSLGTFFLVYRLLDGKPFLGKVLAGFFAITLYGFYSAVSNGPGYSITGTFLPVSMLFALLLAESVNQKKENKRIEYAYITLLTLSLGMLFTFGGAAYIIQDLFTIALPMLMLFVFATKSRKATLFKYYVFSIFIAALIVSPEFVSSAIFTNTVGNQFFSGSVQILKYLDYQNLFTSLQLYANPGSSRIYDIYEITLVVFSLSSLIYLDKKDKSKMPFIIGIFVSLFVIVFIWDNFGAPFGSIFSVLLTHFKELMVFRYSGSSLYYCEGFVYAVLGGFGIGSIYGRIDRAKQKNILRMVGLAVFILLIIALIIIRIYYLDYINYVSYKGGITIPGHVYNISDYINSQNGSFNVGLLPVESPFMHFATWYEGTNIYTYFINNPAFTGGYVAASEMFFPPSRSIYLSIGEKISENQTRGRVLTNALDALGIRYMIVQGDTLYMDDEQAFSFNAIRSSLNGSGLNAVYSAGNSTVYKNKGYLPLVYASNILNIANASSSNILSVIENSTFEVNNTSVFSTYISGFYNDSNTINAMPINGFSEPTVGFVDNNPTQVTVHVRNATTPFYLIFRETYDPHWAAIYANGTRVPQRNHIAVNGFANAWYMNKTGNYTMTLYYTPQTEAWISWFVSFAALFVTVGIGVYSWKGMRKGRRAENLYK